MSFGARLSEERKRIGMNQKDFGAVAGVTKTSQLNYENEQRSPNVDYLQAIATLGVDIQYILTGIREKTSVIQEKAIHYAVNKRAQCMAELLDALNDDQQKEIFTIIEEKKRLNQLEATVAQLVKKAG